MGRALDVPPLTNMHQLLPTAAIDGSTNVRSYEYGFAARTEQYYGELQWDLVADVAEAYRNVRDQQFGRASAVRSTILGHELHLRLAVRRQTNFRTLRRVGGLVMCDAAS